MQASAFLGRDGGLISGVDLGVARKDPFVRICLCVPLLGLALGGPSFDDGLRSSEVSVSLPLLSGTSRTGLGRWKGKKVKSLLPFLAPS